MNTYRLFIAAGLVWGLLLGALAAVWGMALAAGIAWIFLFGDKPWPGWVDAAILTVATALGLGVFAGCVSLGWAAGRNCRDAAPAVARRGAMVASGLIGLALVAAATLTWLAAERRASSVREAEGRSRAHASLSALAAGIHRFEQIEVDWPGGGADGRAGLVLAGDRAGAYRLDWQIRGAVYDTALLAGSTRLNLAAGRHGHDVPIPATALVDGYRDLLERQDADIMVDEAFRFVARLTPLLDPASTDTLPAGEVRALAEGWSPLIGKAAAEFPVRFFLYDGVPSWESQ